MREQLTALVERWRADAAKTIARPFDNESLVAEAEQIAEAGIFTICADALAAILAEADDALLNASPAPVKASRAVADGAAACDCCDGRGEVGGLLLDGGGYQTDPCPYCDGTGIQPAPPLLDSAMVAELERLAAVATPAPWDDEGEDGEIMAWLEPDEHRSVGKIWSLDWRHDVPLILLLRNNLPAILAALRQGTALAAPASAPSTPPAETFERWYSGGVTAAEMDAACSAYGLGVSPMLMHEALIAARKARQASAPPTVTDAMVEAALVAERRCRGVRDSMRAALAAALQAQRGE